MPQYVRNEDLLNEILNCKELKKLTPLALEFFQKMVDEISLEFRYKNPIDREDCKSEAFYSICKYWKKFDTSKSLNPFAYFTQMIKNGFGIGFNKLFNKKLKTISLSTTQSINYL